MKALIIDDEIHCREVLQSYVKDYAPLITDTEEAYSVDSALEKIKAYQPDVVFLDIQLHQRTSFELLEQLDEINFKIIFTTAYDKYALKAFEYAAVHYLLKPITPNNFKEAVQRCNEADPNEMLQHVERAKNFYLRTSSSTHNILFEEVLYIQADGSYSKIFKTDDQHIFASKKLADYKNILPAFFFRIHNSVIVNMNFVQEIKEKENLVVLADGSGVSVSRRKKKAFKEALSNLGS